MRKNLRTLMSEKICAESQAHVLKYGRHLLRTNMRNFAT